jgi:lysophospholipase L1-like esterase
MIRTTTRFSAAALGLLLAASACENDTVNRPFSNVPVDPLFDRYVSIGNSLTAGYQSGGILDSTQLQAYPVLLARAMHAPFFVPLLKRPGCPPPYTNVFTGARLTPTGFPTSTGSSCYLRVVPAQAPPFISNVAVPGAKVINTYNNLDPVDTSNVLTTFFLGGLTQTQMMARAEPTFVSVWIGNNDVLGAATSSTNGGDSTLITAVATFQNRYGALLDTVAGAKPKGVVLIGVANVTGIPYFSLGSTYFALKAGGTTFPAIFTVSANCAPSSVPGGRGDSTLVPFPYGAALVGAAAAGAPRNLDCGDTVAAIVVPAELRRLVASVNAYNVYISGQATARGWAYYNPNTAFDSLRTVAAAVRPFPLLSQPCIANPFGTAFSCDAVHPSAATHRLIAEKLRQAINTAYTTAIPPIP